MDEFYKDHHISQMHSNGTTAYDTFIAIIPSSLVTFNTVLLDSLLYGCITNRKKWQYILEYIVLVLPIILSITICSKYLKAFLVTLAVIAVSLVLLFHILRPSKFQVNSKSIDTSYLTNARSTINILSVIAILAVDFNVFPRHFAKTESFGYSLMDVGVGLFMYSNGIVAPETRGRKYTLKQHAQSSLPLFILGIARFISVKQTDYAVPVSEYGVHWNFFITLGITKIFCAFILNVIKIKYLFTTTIILSIFHETLLQAGLQDFVLLDLRRDDWITANREGLVSSLGYICIYLYSVYFGHYLHIQNQSKDKISLKVTFVAYSLLMLILSVILKNYFGISRKLANSAYCFWILFIGIFMTGIYYFSQILLKYIYKDKWEQMYSPLIFQSVNYNGLTFFLIGNLLTGLVNIFFDTLTLNDITSLIILVFYMFLNCLIVTILYCKKYKLRF